MRHSFGITIGCWLHVSRFRIHFLFYVSKAFEGALLFLEKPPFAHVNGDELPLQVLRNAEASDFDARLWNPFVTNN